MAEGLGTPIVVAMPFPAFTDCPKAGDLVTSVRDLIPDPVYDEDGMPQPDADGSYLRAQTLYRWLSGGIRELTRRTNWMIQDWTAMPQEHTEQVVTLDRRFVNVDSCFCNQYRLLHLDEVHTTYPSQAVAQPLWYSWHHRSDKLELSLWPAPDRTDPVVTLMNSLDPNATSVDLSSVEGFLPFGWVRIEGELMQYHTLRTEPNLAGFPGLEGVRRGTGGTPIRLHFAGVKAQHLGVWARGWRAPAAVTSSTECVEVPWAFVTPLETYLLARVKEAEQSRQEAASLMQEFREQVESIVTDPTWQQPPYPMQVRAYGSAMVGGLAYGRVIVP